VWKAQKKLSAPPFSRSSLFQPEQFHEFERTFRSTVSQRLQVVREMVRVKGGPIVVNLEPEIKSVMLELLVNNFFGASVPYEQVRSEFVPAIDRVIDHIVRDTVVNKVGCPLHRIPTFTKGLAATKRARKVFEDLTSIVLSTRREKKGQWSQFSSDASDEALRSNVRVFLAGALEATTSYASWAIAHLARSPAAQERLHQEVRDVESYSPESLEHATYLGHVLNETLRLTPALYFHPRRASADTWVETLPWAHLPAVRLFIPQGTHILLDIWHANRHDDHWGVSVSGYPAEQFVPERWERLAADGRASNELLHFGFGHGPRFCPGKNLGQLEVALVVGAFVKLFRFAAPPDSPAGHAAPRAGVSTKPLDGTRVELRPAG
jgi:cytochrome P450